MERRRFSWEFKREAVRLVQAQGVPIAQASAQASRLERALDGAQRRPTRLSAVLCRARHRQE